MNSALCWHAGSPDCGLPYLAPVSAVFVLFSNAHKSLERSRHLQRMSALADLPAPASLVHMNRDHKRGKSVSEWLFSRKQRVTRLHGGTKRRTAYRRLDIHRDRCRLALWNLAEGSAQITLGLRQRSFR